MATFSGYSSRSTGLIGPYQYVGWSSSLPHNCSCEPECCDDWFTLEYGTINRIAFDWCETLEIHHECKIFKSQWAYQQTDAAPIVFHDAEINGTQTSVKLGGGAPAREYKVINRITTEEGTTHQKVLCIKIKHCLENIVYADENCDGVFSYEERDYENWDTSLEYTIKPGTYTRNHLQISHKCIEQLNLTLVMGTATFTNDAGTQNLSATPFVIENATGDDIGNFVINVSTGSLVYYTYKLC